MQKKDNILKSENVDDVNNLEGQLEKVFTIDEDTEKIENSILFMNAILARATHMMTSFDTQINILVGIEISVCVLSITNIEVGKHSLTYFILGLFSIVSAVFGVYAIHPPKKVIKKGQIESLFYNKKIVGYPSHKEYADVLLGNMESRKGIVNEFAMEIYNTYKYHYRPRRELFKISRFVFLFGVVLAMVVYFFF